MFPCFPAQPTNNGTPADSNVDQFFQVHDLQPQQAVPFMKQAQGLSIEEKIENEILNLNMQLQMHRTLKLQQLQMMQQSLYAQPLVDFYSMSYNNQLQQQLRLQQMLASQQQQSLGLPFQNGFRNQNTSAPTATFANPSDFMNTNNNNNIVQNTVKVLPVNQIIAKTFEESSETHIGLNEKRKYEERTEVIIPIKKICTEDSKSISSSPHLVTSICLGSPNQQPTQMPQAASSSTLPSSMQSLSCESLKSQKSKKLSLENSLAEKKKVKKSSEGGAVQKKVHVENDSNYTKNLLKGFRRHMSIKWKNEIEELEKFMTYFANNTLSNEFILILIHESPYTDEFNAFMGMDPAWWIKEAKIKDVSRQMKFFNAVIRRDYSEIRTKRKGKASAINHPIATTQK